MHRTTSLRSLAAALAAAILCLFAPAAFGAAETIFATAVGTADDTNGDNVGDEGAAAGAFFISAAVHASGATGENGTVRMQFEFDISGLGSGPVTSAQVNLNTENNEAFSPIDTQFFAGTNDGDGTIEASDFQTAAVAIPGAVMSHTGTGTFNFDVTSEVNAALAAGHHWFVVQGRIDETLGPTFERGLQVDSNQSFVPQGQHPRLLIVTDAVINPLGSTPAVPVPALADPLLGLLTLALGGLALARMRRSTRRPLH